MERKRTASGKGHDRPQVRDPADKTGSGDQNERARWLEYGAEDPAFFIKTSDEDRDSGSSEHSDR